MDHEKYMRRCLYLASLGKGRVSPNPMVGSVIVHNDLIIGEGYHTEFGKAHGEIEALKSVRDMSLLPDSTLYVNLEPCSHYGKTPPCAERIVEEGIGQVVIAASDPNPLVAGNGIRLLEKNGIKVISGVLEKEALELNKRFYCFHQNERPYVILKWAQTSDGIIGHIGKGERLMITNEPSNTLVHKWRSEEQAILVGKNTALFDDPLLNVRKYEGRNPERFVIDANLDLSNDLRLFNDGSKISVFNLLKNEVNGNIHYVKIPNISAKEILSKAALLNIGSILIEGGAKTLEMFINEGLWDEARIITSKIIAGSGVNAPVIYGETVSVSSSEGDEIRIIKNHPTS